MSARRLMYGARALLGLRPPPGEANHAVYPSRIATPPRPLHDGFTRLYNLLGAGVGLLVLGPLMAALAIAVRLTDPGPSLYRGARVGRGQRPFTIFKFRTMKIGSEQKIGQRLVRADEDHYTPIGRFLRKYRLDELPQLFNVLRGDMSLVGPRPLRPIFLDEHIATIPGYARRFLVRPGITGLAQVRGGYYTRPRHKLFYDLLYVARRSVPLDLLLIVLTFVRVMTRIFTTTLLLGWLLAAVLLLPAEVHRAFTVAIAGVELNPLYLVPLAIVAVHLLRKRAEGARTNALRTSVDLPLIGFLAFALLMAPFTPDAVASLRGLAWYVCNGAVVFFLVLNSRMVTTARGPLVAILVALTAAVALADMVPRLIALGEGQGFGRLSGTLVSPLLFATVVVIALPLAFGRARRAAGRSRVIWGLAVGLLAIAGVLTLSRSGILAGAIALALYLWPSNRRAVVGVMLGLAVLIGGLVAVGDARLQPSRTLADLELAVERQSAVLGALDGDPALPDLHWVTGVGPRVLARLAQRDGWRAHKPPLKLDNMYLTVLVDHGPVGLVLFLAFLIGGLARMLRAGSGVADAAARDDLRAAAAGLVGCAILFLFSDGLYALPVTLVFFAAMGLGVGIATHYQSGPRPIYRLVRRHDPL